MAVKKDPRTLEVAEPFKSLFPVERDVLQLVAASMSEQGFDATKPLLLWKDAFGERGRQVVIDGHTRLQAALDLKLSEIWATVRQYKGVDAAITAGIGEQVIRRNLNREQIAAYVIGILPLLDEKKGGLRTRSATELAKLLGVSKPTVDRARSLLGSGRDDLVDKVKNGEISLLAAWQESLNGNGDDESWPPRASNIMTAAEVIADATPPPFVSEPEPASAPEQDESESDEVAETVDRAPGHLAVEETDLDLVRYCTNQVEEFYAELEELLVGSVVAGTAEGEHVEVHVEHVHIDEENGGFVYVSGTNETGKQAWAFVSTITEIIEPAPVHPEGEAPDAG